MTHTDALLIIAALWAAFLLALALTALTYAVQGRLTYRRDVAAGVFIPDDDVRLAEWERLGVNPPLTPDQQAAVARVEMLLAAARIAEADSDELHRMIGEVR